MKEITLCALPMSCWYQKCHLSAADSFSTSENASLCQELCIIALGGKFSSWLPEQGHCRWLSPGAARNGQKTALGAGAVC